MTKVGIEQVSAGTLIIALLFFLAAAAQQLAGNQSVNSFSNQSSIIERDAAIERARQGSGEYSYSTNFLPGIGQAVSPDQVKESFIKENPSAITN